MIRYGALAFTLGVVIVFVTTVVGIVRGSISWPEALLIVGVQCIVIGLAAMVHNHVRRRRLAKVFTGHCVICGEDLELVHNQRDGIIDIGIGDDNRVFTQIRHLGGPRPGCEIYSSSVWLEDTSSTTEVDRS